MHDVKRGDNHDKKRRIRIQNRSVSASRFSQEYNFELWDVEYVKGKTGTWYLRAYMIKKAAIAVDDCEGDQPYFK